MVIFSLSVPILNRKIQLRMENFEIEMEYDQDSYLKIKNNILHISENILECLQADYE